MLAYYNEIDPHAAQWLRNLIAAGHIAPGDVDERSIVEVKSDDLRGYQQCHFFAGIGGWSYALRLAGIPDDRPVWTGSCPCQPFSTAGKQRGCEDERHLWPTFFRLIRECRPASVFGEQVAGINGLAWIDHVFADMEDEDYAVGAADLPACGAGAPHRRQRLFWVANAKSERGCWWESRPNGTAKPGRSGETDWLANANRSEQQTRDRITRTKRQEDVGCLGANGSMADPMHAKRRENHVHRTNGRDGPNDGRKEARRESRTCGEVFLLGDSKSVGQQGGFLPDNGESPNGIKETDTWNQLEWLTCSDGKSRPSQPGIFPLVDGIPKGLVRGGDRSMAPDANQSAEARTMRLKGYGNAIVPQVAAIFITAAMQSQ